MLVDFFHQYYLNTDDLQEKLAIISKSNTENASFVSHIFQNAIKYVSRQQELHADNVIGIEEIKEAKATCMVYFDNCMNSDMINEKIESISHYVNKIVVVGNYKTRKINDHIIFISIQQANKVLNEIKNQEKILFGFYLKSIDNTKYYYYPMKCYFLNVCEQLSKIDMHTIQADVEGTCTNIVLNPNNRNSHYEQKDLKIELKTMMKLYNKALKQIGNDVIEKRMVCIRSDTLSDMEICALNSISELIDIYRMENEEKISYVYDRISAQMLDEVKALQYCFFVDNQCVGARYQNDSFPHSNMNGCCNNTYLDKNKNCRYMKEDHSCSICSISCRVFTCRYLQDRGIDHALWQYPLIDCVFKKIIRSRIIYGFFMPKEKMLIKLKHGTY